LENNISGDEIFRKIKEVVPGSVGNRTEEELWKVYDGGDISGKWKKLYFPILVEDWVTNDFVNSVIKSSAFRLDLYYRANGRFPGGNADIHTVLYTFLVTKSKTTTVIKHHSNWDGIQCYFEGVPRTAIEIDSMIKKIPLVVEKDGVKSLCSLKNDSSYDDYDTEWTSQEILVFAPRPWSPSTHQFFPLSTRLSIKTFLLVYSRLKLNLPRDLLFHIFNLVAFQPDPLNWAPVFRLNRIAAKGTKISNTQEQILDCMDVMIGMARVNTFTDAGDGDKDFPCEARKMIDVAVGVEKKNEYRNMPYIQPSYFRVVDFEKPKVVEANEKLRASAAQ